jgi:hypothetical protein
MTPVKFWDARTGQEGKSDVFEGADVGGISMMTYAS